MWELRKKNIVRKILKVFSEFPKKVAKMHALVSVIP